MDTECGGLFAAQGQQGYSIETNKGLYLTSPVGPAGYYAHFVNTTGRYGERLCNLLGGPFTLDDARELPITL